MNPFPFQSLALTAILAYSAVASLAAPDESLPKCPSDWKVELIAQAPQILHPSVVCAAPDGRVFVGQDPMDMPGPADKPVDSILCFHPDGHVTMFATNLYSVFGIAYIDGKVYVHHTPKVTVFRDDHGVGKDPEELIASTNPRPWGGTMLNDHIPSNFRLAMDGFLYMSTGDKGIFGAIGKDGSKLELRGGGIIRFRTDGTRLEVYSSGTRNHLDVAINDEDEMFTYDNTDDGNGWWTRVTHMVDGGYYGYPFEYKPRRPYTLWMMTDYGGGSPTGAMTYNEDALPETYRGDLFLCEWGRAQLLRLKVAREGASYKIVSRQDFLTRGRSEFRPVGINVTPEGDGFYIADWNYGGWKNKTPAGRLLKVTYTGPSQAAPKPAWYLPAATGQSFSATDGELVAGLSHPAESVRLVAQRRLVERGQAVVPSLRALVANAGAPPRARWSAIWTLDGIDEGKSGRTEILAAARDPELSTRLQAIRQLGARQAPEAAAPLEGMLSDSNPAVRFRAATALGRIHAATSIDGLTGGLDQTDLFERYSYFRALRRIGEADPSAWGKIARGLNSTKPRVVEGTLFAFRNAYQTEAAQALADFAASAANSAGGRAAALSAVAELALQAPAWDGSWWATQPVKSPPPAKTRTWEGTETARKAIEAALDSADTSMKLAGIAAAQSAGNTAFAATLRSLYLKESSDAIRGAILRALGELKDAESAGLVAGVIRQPEPKPFLASEAVFAAGRIGGPEATEALLSVVKGTSDSELKSAAVDGLANLKARAASAGLADAATGQSPGLRRTIASALARIGGADAEKGLMRIVGDPDLDVRKAAIDGLGLLKSRQAIHALLAAAQIPETKTEAVAALAATPDVRALDFYLEALSGRNSDLTARCRNAINAIRAEALPLIEARLDNNPLPPATVAALQKIYRARQPVRQWMVAGPFENPPKNPVSPDTTSTEAALKDKDGKEVHWTRARGNREDGAVNLLQIMSEGSDVTAYALANIPSEEERDVEFTVGADDSITLWLNGKRILHEPEDHGWSADQFHAAGRLGKGDNHLLAEIGQHGGDWMFSVSYSSAGKGRLFQAAARKADATEYAAFALAHPGSPDHGRAIFADVKGVACAKCHKVAGAGGEVGPDLSAIGAKYDRAQLAESVLFPSKLILDGYQQTVVFTKDGEVTNGILRGETEKDLTLIDTEGKKHSIAKADIDQKKTNDLSLMPEGLQDALSLADFADLIAYLQKLK
jgi:putative heme-binding domain-containing protein